MSSDDAGSGGSTQLRIWFDSTDEDHVLEWAKFGRKAMLDVVSDVNASGPTVTEKEDKAPGQDEARGLGVDFLIGLVSAGSATLLVDFLARLVVTMFSRQPRPAWVSLEAEAEAEAERLSLNASEMAASIHDEVAHWCAEHQGVLDKRLTLRMY